MACGSGVGVEGAGVGGTGVGGTGVGGRGVSVTTTGVGGMLVLVGSASTTVVEVGTAGAWVVTGGGAPAAGNLHAVMTSASIAIARQLTKNFLFMFASFVPSTKIPMIVFYIILPIA